MRSINGITTILFAAMTLVAARAQSLQPVTFLGGGTGTSTGSGGGLQGTGYFGGAATFSVTFTNGQLLGQNGSTGTCSLEVGTFQVTTSSGTITMDQVGTSCNVTKGPAPNTLNATFLVTGGTGAYAGVAGTGSLVVGFSASTGAATGLVRMDGVLR